MIKDLLDQIISLAEQQDKEWKAINLAKHKASQTIGDSALIFHLNALKELINREEAGETIRAIENIDGRSYFIALGQQELDIG